MTRLKASLNTLTSVTSGAPLRIAGRIGEVGVGARDLRTEQCDDERREDGENLAHERPLQLR